MAKGQMRSNKEKKKPKANANLKKGGSAEAMSGAAAVQDKFKQNRFGGKG